MCVNTPGFCYNIGGAKLWRLCLDYIHLLVLIVKTLTILMQLFIKKTEE